MQTSPILKKATVINNRMCGILAISGNSTIDRCEFREHLEKIKHRGPDSDSVWEGPGVMMGINRLAVNGEIQGGAQQPFTCGPITLVCNGEIFNHLELEDELGYTPQTGSDCECLAPWMHRELNFQRLDAEFAMVVYNSETGVITAARDPWGVRPLFWGRLSQGGGFAFASELKAICTVCTEPTQFPPGTFMQTQGDTILREVRYSPTAAALPGGGGAPFPPPLGAQAKVRELLSHAVKKRLMCQNGGVCCLLSGGLDSSLVAALAQEHIHPQKLHTFAVGMAGSPEPLNMPRRWRTT